MKSTTAAFIVAIMLTLMGAVARADLLLTAAPLFDKKTSEALYQPLAEAMSEVLEQKVIYEHPDDWLQYAKVMRTGRYDLIFDQAHFAAWRLMPQNIFHETVARLPGENRYLVLTKAEDPAFGISDLLSREICALPSPSLSTMVVLSQFNNPVRQPVMVEAQGRFEDVFKKFKRGECEAAVVSQRYYEEEIVSTEDQELTKVLYTSNPIPNLVLTITKKHPSYVRQDLMTALTDELSPKGSDKIFETFTNGEASRYIEVESGELDPLKNMLQGVLWGW